MVGKDNDGNSLNMSEKFSDCVGLRGERGASDNSRERWMTNINRMRRRRIGFFLLAVVVGVFGTCCRNYQGLVGKVFFRAYSSYTTV